ncbi:MAG TPA: glycosyltransferase 87 family protein, partial [Leptospiraceae bacterium]|nr:glycosyltransferase 87 family protein [Leptospiraceae bacterium]
MLERIKKFSPYLLGIILLVLLVQSIGRADNKSDFHDYYTASRLFYDQKDLYNINALESLREEVKLEDLFKAENLKKLEALKGNLGTYIYPPLFAFLLIPLGFLNYELAATIFTLINFSCLLLSLFLITKLIPIKNIFSILFFTIAVNYRYLESHVSNNQVAFILILLILLSLLIKNDALSGILLSLAIIIKITPAIFLFYFLY